MKSKSEEIPFLDRSTERSELPSWHDQSLQERYQRAPPFVKATLCGFLLLLYTVLVIAVTLLLPRQSLPLNNALNNPNLRYQPTLSITAGMSPYAGGPEDKIDEAWHELMSSISVRVTQSELNRNGNHQESVSLPVGGGNLVWLGVFHQLHCLKMIRQMNYRDHYFPNQTEHDAKDLEVHINHCIENLRQALMCNPDTSFTTFVWTHSNLKPVLDVRRFERQCVDWEYFMEGVAPRVVSYEEVDELVNPFLNSTA